MEEGVLKATPRLEPGKSKLGHLKDWNHAFQISLLLGYLINCFMSIYYLLYSAYKLNHSQYFVFCIM